MDAVFVNCSGPRGPCRFATPGPRSVSSESRSVRVTWLSAYAGALANSQLRA